MSDFMDGIQSMGIVNALRTGDVVIDMIVAMCIPLLIRAAFQLLSGDNLTNLIKTLVKWITRKPDDDDGWHERTITHIVEKDRYENFNSVDSDSHNEVLIKAITMYLHHLQCTFLQHASLRLTALTQTEDNDDNSYDSDSCDSDEGNSKTFAGLLKTYKIIKNPPEGCWHKVGKKYFSNNMTALEDEAVGRIVKQKKGVDDEIPKDGMYDVEFMLLEDEKQTEAEEGEEGREKKKTILKERREVKYRLRSKGKAAVDSFVSEAYKWYVGEIQKSEKDTTRFMFDMKPKDLTIDEDSHNTFKKYKLSDEKSFDSLFFREKKTIVKLFRHFLDKTGKYGIRGYPQKLGLLLHGPPGTGKTSFIKAVAQYTGRHIVNIPLGRIRTNEELTRLFFSGEYHIENQYYPKKLGFDDVIFVMEDVDAASKLVQRRDGKKTADVVQTQHVDLPATKCMWMMLLESNHEDCVEVVELLVERSERLKERALAPETLHQLAQRMNSIPGMSLVGHQTAGHEMMESKTIQKIADDALEEGERMQEGGNKMNEYLAFHARSIKRMLQMGAEIDENFEDELLGLSPSEPPSPGGTVVLNKPNVISRNVSYSKYQDSHLEVDAKEEFSSNLLGANMGMMDMMMGMGSSPMPKGFNMKNAEKNGLPFGGGAAGDTLDDISLTGRYTGFSGGRQRQYGKTNGGPGGSGGMIGGSFGTMRRDALNLSGLLNVLDGVVDTPGRILIMTTNHPEKLDPALIRPGRIDKKLILGYMEADDVNDMLEHYFQIKLADDQKGRIRCAIQGDTMAGLPALNLTPAQVEQLTAEYDEIDDMISALEAKSKPLVPQPLGKQTREKKSTSSIAFA